MDDKIEQILELLKWCDSSELKSMQTKFTKTANAISKDALNSRLSVLYTEKELGILREAALLLKGTKSKIEHAKEIKQRDEARLKKLDEQYAQQIHELVKTQIDTDNMAPTELLIMYLCLEESYLHKYIDSDIDHLMEEPKRLKATASDWQRKIEKHLKEKFGWREAPNAEVLVSFLRNYQLKDRKMTLERNKRLLEKFDTFLAIQNGGNVEVLKKPKN